MNKAYICSNDGLEIIETCHGPAPGGRCPRVRADEAVACAGHSLLATAPSGRRALLLRVEPGAEACPLAVASWVERAKVVWPSAGTEGR